MIIKVCGMRDPENISELVDIRPDYVGFILYPHSKRFVGTLDPEALSKIPGSVKKTGVFVDEAMDVIADEVIKYNLDAVQLHGDESPDFCMSLKKFLHNMQTEKDVEIIKAFGITKEFDFGTLTGYEDFVEFYLFDTSTVGHGGSGLTFDWAILNDYKGKKPYFLSGGLSPDNLHAISEIKDVRLHGVDLNSKFEVEPGLKDISKLKSAFGIIRAY